MPRMGVGLLCRVGLLLACVAFLTVPGVARAAFSTTATKLYSTATRSVTRLWIFGGGNGTPTGLYVNTPTSILIDCAGSSFDSGTVTLEFSTTNGAFAVLANQSITFTSNSGPQIVSQPDTKTGFYSPVLSGTAGTASSLTCLMVVSGAVDVE